MEKNNKVTLKKEKKEKNHASWFNEYTPELVPIFYYWDQTWVQMFISKL